MDRGSIRDALSGASVILGGIVTMYLVAMYSFSIAHLSELLRAINSIARTVPAPLFTGILIVGPVAFPMLPPDGEDLPHILDVPDREPDRADLVEAAERRLRGALFVGGY